MRRQTERRTRLLRANQRDDTQRSQWRSNTAVKQAELFKGIAAADKIKIINKTLLDAAQDYWQWYHAYYQYRLLHKGVAIAAEIFKRTRLNVAQGEAAAIDTVQAKITLQSRLVERQEALLAFQNTVIMASNYLWDQQMEPVQLSNALAPILTTHDQVWFQHELLEDLVKRARENHPELVKLSVKLSQLEVERLLAREFLKPQLDLNYAALSQPSANRQIDLFNDYKVGLDFSFPIFLRKERSKIALNKIKIESTQFQRSQSEREIVNGINSTFNELTNTLTIILQQEEVVNLYNRLLIAELLNLKIG